MAYGLQIENPSGTLVLSSEANAYCYKGRVTTVVQTSAKTGSTFGTLNQWIYSITMSQANTPPIVGVAINNSTIVEITSLYKNSSTVWYLYMYAVNYSGATTWSSLTVATPTVYAWEPYTASSETYGLRMYNASGTLTFDSGKRPLYIQGTSSFSQLDYTYTPYDPYGSPPAQVPGTWSPSGYNTTYNNNSGQLVSLDTSINTPIILVSSGGSDVSTRPSTGEDVYYSGYGFMINPSNSAQYGRYRFLTYQSTRTFNQYSDDIAGFQPAITQMLVSGSGLT